METEARANVKAEVTILASENSWIEGEAIRQLNRTAEMPGMLKAVELPDIHPGKGHPIGAVFLTSGIIYPFLIGNDIGCGMGLWKTSLKRKKIKLDKWAKKQPGLEMPQTPTNSLGTIGGGNHFAELQVVDQVADQKTFYELKLDKDHLMLLVHSGSRGIGETLLRNHTAKFGTKGLEAGFDAVETYLKRHDDAIKWAQANRALIAQRFIEQLGGRIETILDLWHNGISSVKIGDQAQWIHRKGAAPSDKGPLVIPGTRGSKSYLVVPVGDQRANLWSLAHGAGRKWNRSNAIGQLKSRYSAKSLVQTELGSRVICEDKDLLYEEAPQAYKKIESVINDMLQAGLIAIIATLKPLITYKVRK